VADLEVSQIVVVDGLIRGSIGPVGVGRHGFFFFFFQGAQAFSWWLCNRGVGRSVAFFVSRDKLASNQTDGTASADALCHTTITELDGGVVHTKRGCSGYRCSTTRSVCTRLKEIRVGSARKN
jgi:hypothetical protein